MNHPCFSGPDGGPCGVFVGPEKSWGPGNCRLCWLYATSPRHRAAWGGSPAKKDGRKGPCRYRGETLRDADGRARVREVVSGLG